MATAELAPQSEQPLEKGLKPGALGLISSIVMGIASTAPAYSIAATLFGIVALVGFDAPIVAIIAFVPILLTSIGYSEMNKADPDCGTTFTWATRAFGPRTGWAGGWGIVAADVLCMASLAQVAGLYMFQLFGAHGIGGNPTSPWVLLLGVAWIVAMTYICYRGIEISVALQRALLSIEIVMLVVLSVVALIKVYGSNPPKGSVHIGAGWFNPFGIPSPTAFVGGLILMLFIYWGWDTAVAVNEETRDRDKTPGRAAIISTVILLVTYVLVIVSVEAFAGIGTSGNGLANENNSGDVLSPLGGEIFGVHGLGLFLTKLLVLMVLSSAAASTQTTILPTARTTLSMAAYRAIPRAFGRMHARYLTPTVSTVAMGGISIVLYVLFNYLSHGNVIPDAVTAIGLYIAFYYGLTGFACAWYYRRSLTSSPRNLLMRGILPVLGGLMMYFAGGWSLWADWDVATENSYTTWTMPFYPHWAIGGAFVIFFISALAGLLFGIYCRFTDRAFFRKETLTRSTPTLVPEDKALVLAHEKGASPARTGAFLMSAVGGSDVGEDLGERLGGVGDRLRLEAQLLHDFEVVVDLGLLVEIERAGQLLHVHDVLDVGLAEAQDREWPAHRRMSARPERQDLERHGGMLAHRDQVLNLITDDLTGPNGTTQRTLVDNGPVLWRVDLLEDLLAADAELAPAPDLILSCRAA
jgi:amino acid transporter